MKSTFHNEITTVKQQNGAFVISFMASRGSAHDFSSGKLVFIAIILIIFGIPAILAFGLGLIMVALGLGMLVKAYLYRSMLYQLTVIPGEGITWSSNRLPVADITKLGIHTLQGQYGGRRGTGSMVSESSYVYASAGGREIQLTKNMPTARADAVLEAISGCLETNH